MAEWQNKDDYTFTTFENPGYSQMVLLKDIDFNSMCSHHCLPFHGVAHVAYIPDKLICGISKLARVVDQFACRPQVQEQLTEEVVNFIQEKMNPLGVMVVMEAQHDCMRIRVVKKQNSIMTTSAFRGAFEKQDARNEFMQLINR